MINFTKNDYELMAQKRKWALTKIAEKLGKDHQITKMMGCMAWGRNNAEEGAQHTLRNAIREMSFLDGAFDVLNHWARDNDKNAQEIMLKIYPLTYETSK